MQLLDELKGTRRYQKFKEEALDRIVWRTGFGKDMDLYEYVEMTLPFKEQW